MKRLQIGVIGSAGCEEYPNDKPNRRIFKAAYEVGKIIASKNAILVCGGKGGIMEEACRGAKENSGITVGIISGNKLNQSNKYVDVEVVSGSINCSEESLIISMSDGIIGIGGGSGTLQEIATAYRNKKPVVAIKGIPGWANKLAGTYLDDRKTIKIGYSKSPINSFKLLLKKIKMIR